MNTHAPTNAAKRVLVLLLAAGAFTFSACGSENGTPDAAPPAEDSGYWDGSLYPRSDDTVRAPRAMGIDPTIPVRTQRDGSTV